MVERVSGCHPLGGHLPHTTTGGLGPPPQLWAVVTQQGAAGFALTPDVLPRLGPPPLQANGPGGEVGGVGPDAGLGEFGGGRGLGEGRPAFSKRV